MHMMMLETSTNTDHDTASPPACLYSPHSNKKQKTKNSKSDTQHGYATDTALVVARLLRPTWAI